MAETANTKLSEQFVAAFAWWREAGVDSVFHDEPADWLAAVETTAPAGSEARRMIPAAALAPVKEPIPTIADTALPPDIATFARWWLSEPLLDEGRLSGRLAPRGEAGAAVMIVVPEPEREDQERLLSGPQGRLLEAFLSAAGIAVEQVYFASALPRNTPMADWDAAAARGIGNVLRHHVALASPRRVIAFGTNVLSLLHNDPPLSGQFSHRFNHGDLSIPLFAAMDLDVLLARPRAKSRFWQQWLDWTGPD